MSLRKVLVATGAVALLALAGCGGAAQPPAAPAAASAAMASEALTPIDCLGVTDCVGQWTNTDAAVLTLQSHSNAPIDEVVMEVMSLPGLHSTTPVEIGGQQRKALLYTRGRITQLAVQKGNDLVVASIDRVLPEGEARAVLTPLAARAF